MSGILHFTEEVFCNIDLRDNINKYTHSKGYKLMSKHESIGKGRYHWVCRYNNIYMDPWDYKGPKGSLCTLYSLYFQLREIFKLPVMKKGPTKANITRNKKLIGRIIFKIGREDWFWEIVKKTWKNGTDRDLMFWKHEFLLNAKRVWKKSS